MKDDKRLKRKVRNSYIVSTVSITLVLFLLGSVGYLMVAAMKVADTLQEKVNDRDDIAGNGVGGNSYGSAPDSGGFVEHHQCQIGREGQSHGGQTDQKDHFCPVKTWT